MTKNELKLMANHIAEMVYSHKSERSVVSYGIDLSKDFPKAVQSDYFKTCKRVILIFNIVDVIKSYCWGNADEVRLDRKGIIRDLVCRIDDSEDSILYDIIDDVISELDYDVEYISDKIGVLYGQCLSTYLRENFFERPVWKETVESHLQDDQDAIDFLLLKLKV